MYVSQQQQQNIHHFTVVAGKKVYPKFIKAICINRKRFCASFLLLRRFIDTWDGYNIKTNKASQVVVLNEDSVVVTKRKLMSTA